MGGFCLCSSFLCSLWIKFGVGGGSWRGIGGRLCRLLGKGMGRVRGRISGRIRRLGCGLGRLGCRIGGSGGGVKMGIDCIGRCWRSSTSIPVIETAYYTPHCHSTQP